MNKKIVFLFSLLIVVFFVVAGCKTETPVDPDPDLPPELKEDSDKCFYHRKEDHRCKRVQKISH